MKQILIFLLILFTIPAFSQADKFFSTIPVMVTIGDAQYMLTVDAGVWKKFTASTLKNQISVKVQTSTILYVPAASANANNRNEFVTDPAGDVWFIDVDGLGKKLSVGGGGVSEHGMLTGLADDDHPQYQTDVRANTWLATKSTTNLSEGTNLYYTDTRVSSNPTVAANTSHAVNNSNPHNTTATHVGLGNVDNTTDLLKPTSTATQAALDAKTLSIAAGSVSIAGGNTVGLISTDVGNTINAGSDGKLYSAAGAGESTTISDSDNIDMTLTGSDISSVIILDPAGDNILTSSVAGLKAVSSSGTGDVTAGANLGDNFVVRGDGAGKGVQKSNIIIDDVDNLFGVNSLGFETATPDRQIEIIHATNPQIRLTNIDASKYTDFQTNSAGNFIMTNTGANYTFKNTSSNSGKLTIGVAGGNGSHSFRLQNFTSVIDVVSTAGQMVWQNDVVGDIMTFPRLLSKGLILFPSSLNETTASFLKLGTGRSVSNSDIVEVTTDRTLTGAFSSSAFSFRGALNFDALNDLTGASYNDLYFAETFAPNTANKDISYTAINFESTINQTGTAIVGITRGIYLNPTLTSAVDYRAIELTNNTGVGINQTGTAPNFFAGTIETGGATATLGTHVIDTDQIVGASEDNFVETYDDATGEISLKPLPETYIYGEFTTPIGINANVSGTTIATKIVSALSASAEWTTAAGIVTKTVTDEKVMVSGSLSVTTLAGGSEVHISMYKNGLLMASTEGITYCAVGGKTYNISIGSHAVQANISDTFEMRIWQDVADNMTIVKMCFLIARM